MNTSTYKLGRQSVTFKVTNIGDRFDLEIMGRGMMINKAGSRHFIEEYIASYAKIGALTIAEANKTAKNKIKLVSGDGFFTL
jgi:hypothetical protein